MLTARLITAVKPMARGGSTSAAITRQISILPRSLDNILSTRACILPQAPRYHYVTRTTPAFMLKGNSFSSTSDKDNDDKKGEDKSIPETTINLVPENLEKEVVDGVTKEDEELAKNIDRSHYTTEIKFNMPDMSSNGVVIKWYKKEGDIIKRGDVICDIELESFTFEMDSDDEGLTIMGPIYVEENSEPVKPGTHLATILHKDDEFKKKDKKSDD